MNHDPRSMGDVFEALADSTRREVIRCLSEGGPVTATGLAARLPVSRQAVAKHLDVLEEAGLVVSERRGRERRFRLSPAPMADAVSWMASIGAQWDERLERLQRMLAESS
jgi:DNA-binding transcriptional ArsR family regulator